MIALPTLTNRHPVRLADVPRPEVSEFRRRDPIREASGSQVEPAIMFQMKATIASRRRAHVIGRHTDERSAAADTARSSPDLGRATEPPNRPPKSTNPRVLYRLASAGLADNGFRVER